MIGLNDQWVLLERSGVRCLFNRWSLRKVYIDSPEEELPDVEQLPRAEPPAMPPSSPATTVFQVVVTEACNLNCAYCGVRLSVREHGMRPRNLDRSLVPVVLERFGEAVSDPDEALFVVTGGEPLLTADVTKMLLAGAGDAGTRLLFTNATLLDEEMARFLAEHEVSLVVSLDGSAAVHDSLRCYPDGSGSWSSAARGIDLAREAGVPFGLSLVVREHNCAVLAREVERLASDLAPASFGLNTLHYTHHGFAPPDPVAYADALVEVFGLARKRGLFVDQIARRLDPLVREEFRFRDCASMGSRLVIFPDLSESNCVNCANPDGDLQRWSEATPLHLSACVDCPAIGICGGGCPFDGSHLSLSGDGIDSRYCIWTLRLLEEILWDIYETTGLREPRPGQLLHEYSNLITRSSAPLSMSVGHSEQGG